VVVQQIAVKAGSFLGMRKIFARIIPNLPEKILHEKRLPKTKLFMLFWAPLAPFLLIFSGIFSVVQGFCEDFQRSCPDFHESGAA